LKSIKNRAVPSDKNIGKLNSLLKRLRVIAVMRRLHGIKKIFQPGLQAQDFLLCGANSEMDIQVSTKCSYSFLPWGGIMIRMNKPLLLNPTYGHSKYGDSRDAWVAKDRMGF
jgi:hypothetical protein